jgi:hypothetical protein
MNVKTLLPIELFHKIASCDLFAMGKLVCCCKDFANIDKGIHIVAKYTLPGGDLGYLHYTSDRYNFEYIHYGEWYVWIIRVDNDNERIMINSIKNSRKQIYYLTKRKRWGSSGLKDINGVLRWTDCFYMGNYVYIFYCDELTLKIVFSSHYMFIPINCIVTEHDND